MKINKKLLVIFFLILIVIVTFIVKFYFEYSLEEIADLVDKSDEIQNNIYIREEIVDELWTLCEKSIHEIFAKDDYIYERTVYLDSNGNITSTAENIIDFKDKNKINIYNNDSNKMILRHSIEGEGKINPVTENLIGFSRTFRSTQDDYKYLGKEELDGKECIKFSLTNEKIHNKTIYYIDIKDRAIAKIESYSITGDVINLSSTSVFTYSYGTVTDEDILDYDINNYQDYEYIDMDLNNI